MAVWQAGQKAVCIDDRGQTVPPFVTKGAVYTVSNTYFYDQRYLEFKEVPRPPDVPPSYGFPAKYFRPVVERPTDISAFKKMLNDAPADLEGVK